MRSKNICRLFVVYVIWCSLLFSVSAQKIKVSAVYGGGPFYYDAEKTISELRKSGFTTAIVWTIHIDNKGSCNFNAEFPLVSDGKYIGNSKYPNFPRDIKLLKTSPTSITRVEFGLSAWGSGTFDNIKKLVNSQGTGSNSILYKNFKVLKEAIPDIDALNFDDESTYDVASSVKFAVMLAGLGYKVALCPYTKASYWKSVASQTNQQSPGAVDAVFLQCYDGGAGNNPGSWTFNGVPVYPGLWSKDHSPSSVNRKMTSWENQYNLYGGFMWLYDEFKGRAKQYAEAINKAFEIGAPEKAEVTSPADGANGISDTASLVWQAGQYSQSHDIYFGEANPPSFVKNQLTTQFFPGLLKPKTKYYWRIDEKNFFGTTTGTVWSFTTRDGTPITPTLSLTKNNQPVKTHINQMSGNLTITCMLPQTVSMEVTICNQKGQILENSLTFGHTAHFKYGKNNGAAKLLPGVYILQVKINPRKEPTEIKNQMILLP